MKKKIGTHVRFTGFLDNEQYKEYDKFTQWLAKDRLDKGQIGTISTTTNG